MSIDLYRIIQPVNDIEAAVRFYSHVLGTNGERVSTGRHYFHCGSTILACYDPAADGDDPGLGWKHHANQYLYFSVADLEAVMIRVRDAGGEIDDEIMTMPWGERLFYCKDLFENPIAFVDESTVFLGAVSDSKRDPALAAFEKLMQGKASIMADMTTRISATSETEEIVEVLYTFSEKLHQFHETVERQFDSQFKEHARNLSPDMKTLMQRHEQSVRDFIAMLIPLKHEPKYAGNPQIRRAVAHFEMRTCGIPREIQ